MVNIFNLYLEIVMGTLKFVVAWMLIQLTLDPQSLKDKLFKHMAATILILVVKMHGPIWQKELNVVLEVIFHQFQELIFISTMKLVRQLIFMLVMSFHMELIYLMKLIRLKRN